MLGEFTTEMSSNICMERINWFLLAVVYDWLTLKCLEYWWANRWEHWLMLDISWLQRLFWHFVMSMEKKVSSSIYLKLNCCFGCANLNSIYLPFIRNTVSNCFFIMYICNITFDFLLMEVVRIFFGSSWFSLPW